MSDKRYLFRGCTVNNFKEPKEKITLYDRIYGVTIEVSLIDYWSMEDETISDFYKRKESEWDDFSLLRIKVAG